MVLKFCGERRSKGACDSLDMGGDGTSGLCDDDMTKIHFERAGNRYTLSAKGHATGSEIVCAGISAILFSLAEYLELDEDARKIRKVMEEANVHLAYAGGKDVETAYTMAMVGLAGLRNSYPELVEIETFEN